MTHLALAVSLLTLLIPRAGTPSGDLCFSQNPSVASETVAGKATLVDPATHRSLVLNEVGSFIWNYLSQPRTEDEIVAAVVASHQVSSQTATRDVQEFLADLQSRGLVVTTERKKPIVPVSSPWFRLLIFVLIVVSIARRRKPMGGFLLYYLSCVPVGLFWAVMFLLPRENPYALAGDTRSYAWSLGLVLPWLVLRLIEASVILPGSLPGARSWGVIRRLKGVLWMQVFLGGAGIVVHALFFPKFIVMDFAALSGVAIWLPYFSRSKRVARVFAKP
jgi:coenzyme PQQ synthesis protein D (PqqD)